MSYVLLEKPLTREQCEAATNRFVSGIISMPLQSVIDHDYEGFLNILEHELIGDIGLVTDLEYNIVGNGMNDLLHIRVTGYADLIGDD